MKRLGVLFSTSPRRMLVHGRSLPHNFVRFPQQFTGTHLYTWVERGTVRVKCLAQEHNTMSPARARTRTLAPESSALTMRPTRLPSPPVLIYAHPGPRLCWPSLPSTKVHYCHVVMASSCFQGNYCLVNNWAVSAHLIPLLNWQLVLQLLFLYVCQHFAELGN